MLTIAEYVAARQPGKSFKVLSCPHCRKVLNPLGPVVLATHNCPHCGRQVLAEPEGDAGAPALTLSQLDEALAAYARAHKRTWASVGIAFGAWFGVVVLAALFADTLRAALGVNDAAGWVIVATLMLPIAVGLVVGLRAEARGKRAAPPCPNCNTPLFHHVHLTRITGNCYACGHRVAEPPPEESAGPLPTVDEYKLAERRANRSVGAAVLLMAVLLAVPGGLATFVNPDRIVAALEPRHGALVAAIIGAAVMFVWTAGLFAVALGGMWYFSRRQHKRRAADPVLTCPSCRSELGMPFQVVATRRCPGCRRRVLADPEPVGVAGEPAAG